MGEAGSLLLGAGLVMIGTDVKIGLLLVGVGSVLKVAVALLNKYGVAVQASNLG